MAFQRIKKVLDDLEDPHHPLLGPNLRALQISYLWYPEVEPQLLIKKAWLYFCTMTGCLFLQYFQYYLLGSKLFSDIQDVSITLQYSLSTLKCFSLIIWRKNFKELMYAVSERELEEFLNEDSKTISIMKNYIKFSRILMYSYWTMGLAINIAYDISPIIKNAVANDTKNDLILNSWFPFSTDHNPGYAISIIVHSFMNVLFGLVLAPYDTLTCSIMMFFNGQLKVLKIKCRMIFGEDKESLSKKEVKKRLQECHRIHDYLFKYSKMFNSILSPVMFIYVLICSFMICASILQLLKEDTESYDQIYVLEYMSSLIVQLFVVCWFAHLVFDMSASISSAVYESGWWRPEYTDMRRDVCLLAGKLNYNFVFTAGPFIMLNLATFISVLKGVYSFYTLISENSFV